MVKNLLFLCLFLTGINLTTAGKGTTGKLQIYPSPKDEPLCKKYTLTVNNRKVDVYNVKVGAADDTRRFKAVDDLLHSADYFDDAAFCYFGLSGQAEITIKTGEIIRDVKILPASKHIPVTVKGSSFTFRVSGPQNLTVEINGEQVKSLHIFINPLEKKAPVHPGANVIYFGPGIHYISSMVVGSNKTVYIAGGAIIRAVISKDEHFTTEPGGLRNYQPTFLLQGNHIGLRGPGIIDATACPTHARSIIEIRGTDIKVEGVILKNPSVWTVPVKQSDSVVIDDIKILGYRANSDGIDICNSNNVTVKNSFVRTNDDLIVLKTFAQQGTMKHVLIENCVLWNQLAHGLSLGVELHEDVSNVRFINCDIIHDKGREWSLRVFQAEEGLISDIRFENINIAEGSRLISAWIGKIGVSENKSLGRINGLTFKNITATSSNPIIEVTGGDNEHEVTDVNFVHVSVNKQPIKYNEIRVNPFVKGLSVTD